MVGWKVFEDEWYGKAMLGTLPYPTLYYPTLPYPAPPCPALPYPTLPPPHLTPPHPHPTTPNPSHPTPPNTAPLRPTPSQSLPYPTLPFPHPTPTPTLLLSCHTPPWLALPYIALAAYVGPFRSVSVVLLSISVYESGLVLSFCFVSVR